MRVSLMYNLISFLKGRIYKFSPITLRVIIHVIRWIVFVEYRANNSFISPSQLFYIRHTKKTVFIASPFLFFIKKYCLRNKIYISVNNIPFAIGHLYPEVDYLLRVLSVDNKYKDATFLYIYPKNSMLNELSTVFSRDNFKIIQSGVLHMLFYFAALKFKGSTDCTFPAISSYSPSSIRS